MQATAINMVIYESGKECTSHMFENKEFFENEFNADFTKLQVNFWFREKIFYVIFRTMELSIREVEGPIFVHSARSAMESISEK